MKFASLSFLIDKTKRINKQKNAKIEWFLFWFDLVDWRYLIIDDSYRQNFLTETSNCLSQAFLLLLRGIFLNRNNRLLSIVYMQIIRWQILNVTGHKNCPLNLIGNNNQNRKKREREKKTLDRGLFVSVFEFHSSDRLGNQHVLRICFLEFR